MRLIYPRLIIGIIALSVSQLFTTQVQISLSQPVKENNSVAKINQKEAAARRLFEQYLKLSWNYNPEILNLYAKDALIQVTIRPQGGQANVMTFSLNDFKNLVLASIPKAKARGDRNTYSEVVYTPEGNKVRIKAKRYSLLHQYTSPHSMLVGLDRTGKWVIFEELIEVKR